MIQNHAQAEIHEPLSSGASSLWKSILLAEEITPEGSTLQRTGRGAWAVRTLPGRARQRSRKVSKEKSARPVGHN
jgi:hypothetical protein